MLIPSIQPHFPFDLAGYAAGRVSPLYSAPPLHLSLFGLFFAVQRTLAGFRVGGGERGSHLGDQGSHGAMSDGGLSGWRFGGHHTVLGPAIKRSRGYNGENGTGSILSHTKFD